MFRRFIAPVAATLIGLSMTAFSSPYSAAAEEKGNPWWIWIIIFLALAAFVAFVLWWWMRSHEDDEEEMAPHPTHTHTLPRWNPPRRLSLMT